MGVSMNGTVLLLGSIIIFAVAYRVYGGFLNKLFNVSNERKTPAHLLDDGIDYVPTKFPVLFGHHFASIAGAGPIVGPIMAAYFGWLPAVLWIIIGCIFIGGVHDFSALIVSARNDGRSIGYVVEKYLGYSGRQIFLIFTLAALLLVVAVFAILIAKICVSNPAVLTSSFLFIAMAPFYGYLVYKKGLTVLRGSFIFVPLLFIFVLVGIYFPFDLQQMFNLSNDGVYLIIVIILLIYCFIASVLPVWLLLQPRDYLNSFLLYVMLLLSIMGILFVSPDFHMPVFGNWIEKEVDGGYLPLFPMLFVIVACGACSGFHSLVSSGTTSKQVNSEKDMLRVGYGAMLVEGVVAIIAVISVAVYTDPQYMHVMSHTSPVNAFANGIGNLIEKIGVPVHFAIVFLSLTISAFMLTTLDTATRLARLTWQELFIGSMNDVKNAEHNLKHKILTNNYSATFICVILAGYLALSGNGNILWPVFGASNQLLAALSLLVVTLYLIHKKVNYWITLLPMIFMLVTSLWGLILLLQHSYSKNEYALLITTAFLIIMSFILAVKSLTSIIRNKKNA
jgi:carbon starvation protein